MRITRVARRLVLKLGLELAYAAAPQRQAAERSRSEPWTYVPWFTLRLFLLGLFRESPPASLVSLSPSVILDAASSGSLALSLSVLGDMVPIDSRGLIFDCSAAFILRFARSRYSPIGPREVTQRLGGA